MNIHIYKQSPGLGVQCSEEAGENVLPLEGNVDTE